MMNGFIAFINFRFWFYLCGNIQNSYDEPATEDIYEGLDDDSLWVDLEKMSYDAGSAKELSHSKEGVKEFIVQQIQAGISMVTNRKCE